MIKHLIAAAALAGCSMVASAAYAGSPYSDGSERHGRDPTASHALGTSHTGEAWANSGYAATANDDSFGSASNACGSGRCRTCHGRVRRSTGPSRRFLSISTTLKARWALAESLSPKAPTKEPGPPCGRASAF